MIALWAQLALAAPPVVAVEGTPRPGIATTLWVRQSDGLQLVVDEGELYESREPTPEGLTAWTWVPPMREGAIGYRLGAETGSLTTSVPEQVPGETWTTPARVDGLAGRTVSWHITGDDLPSPDAVQILLPEGRLVGVTQDDRGLRVEVDPGGLDQARFLLVGVRAARNDQRPSWTVLRLRSRPAVNLETEPGSTATFDVGGRIYGPVTAGEDGLVRATVDQYPGETEVRVLLEDDLGNETVGSLPLRTLQQEQLSVVSTGAMAPGRPAPLVYLAAVDSSGRAWRGGPPQCRTADGTELFAWMYEPGRWVTAIPAEQQLEQIDTRVACELPGGASGATRVAADPEYPARMRLRVWPTELSTDQPVASVSAALENARGDRLISKGIELSATHGTLTLDRRSGFEVEGEYRGAAPADYSEDVVEAFWTPGPGTGVVRRLELGWMALDGPGLEVVVRALDDSGRPRSGADVTLVAGEQRLELRTDTLGWARASLPWEEQDAIIEAMAGGVVRRVLRLAGAGSFMGTPRPVLRATQTLSLSPGRISSISPSVEPPVLYAGPNAVAAITFEVLDRSGQGVEDARLQVSTNHGTLGEVEPLGSGRYRVEVSPEGGDRVREVLVTANAEGSASTAVLLVEPRPLDRSVSVAGGLQTNLRRIAVPSIALDLDQRLPILGRAVHGRLGLAYFGDSEVVETEVGAPVRVSLGVVPVQVLLLVRREAGGRAAWMGLGGVLAGYRLSASFGSEASESGVGLLSPGPAGAIGVGQRFYGGEVFAEFRVSSLLGPSGDVSFSKQVGGLGLWVGYRLLY